VKRRSELMEEPYPSFAASSKSCLCAARKASPISSHS
jgi:hypothetical protein